MDKLPCDMIITFFKDGKFVWETDLDEGGRGQSIDSLISSCNKIRDAFGSNLDWEIGIVSIVRGTGLDNLRSKVEQLSDKITRDIIA
jgi:hypothetical protein